VLSPFFRAAMKKPMALTRCPAICTTCVLGTNVTSSAPVSWTDDGTPHSVFSAFACLESVFTASRVTASHCSRVPKNFSTAGCVRRTTPSASPVSNAACTARAFCINPALSASDSFAGSAPRKMVVKMAQRKKGRWVFMRRPLGKKDLISSAKPSRTRAKASYAIGPFRSH
jgi:hypothetical protein